MPSRSRRRRVRVEHAVAPGHEVEVVAEAAQERLKRVAVRVDGAGQERLAGQALDVRGAAAGRRRRADVGDPAVGDGDRAPALEAAVDQDEVGSQARHRGAVVRPSAGGTERLVTGASRPADCRPLGPAGDRIGHGAWSSGVSAAGRRRVIAGRPRHLTGGVARGSTEPGSGREGALLRQDELAGPRDPEAIFVCCGAGLPALASPGRGRRSRRPAGLAMPRVGCVCVRCGGPARGGHRALWVLHPAPVGVPGKPDLLEPL